MGKKGSDVMMLVLRFERWDGEDVYMGILSSCKIVEYGERSGFHRWKRGINVYLWGISIYISWS